MSDMSATTNNVGPTPSQEDPTKYCCLVVPVRYVLLVLATLALLLSTMYGTIGILVLQRLNVHLTELHRLAIYFHVFVHLSFGFICVLGFYAALSKRPGVTSLYIAIIISQLLFSIGSGTLCLYLLFKTSPSQDLSVDKCAAISVDLFTQNLCQRTQLTKGIAVASLTIIWLVEIATVVVGNYFLSQLREEAMHLEIVSKYDRDGYDC